MQFPVYFDIFGMRLHPHLVLETLAYTIGFQSYVRLRRRFPATAVTVEQGLWLVVGCVFGALIGAKVLAWLELWPLYSSRRDSVAFWLVGGKTIVGGLIGGWLGVEIVKKCFHIRHSTGDAFVFPLIVGMSLGRVGCFLSGLEDDTYGVATVLPWGVNFGDGIARHPTQLYEIAFLIVLGAVLGGTTRRRPMPNGALFRWFMAGYFGFRFAVEFIKPRPYRLPAIDLSAIQLASLVAALVSLWSVRGLPALSGPILNHEEHEGHEERDEKGSEKV